MFDQLARKTALFCGTIWATLGAFLITVGWIIYAWRRNFDDLSQMWYSTITSAATFIMVFIIQNDANRTAKTQKINHKELIAKISELEAKLKPD